MSTENQTELEQVRAEQRALKIRVLAENLENLAVAAQSALEQAEGLGLTVARDIAQITTALATAQRTLRAEVGGVPASTLRVGDVIPHQGDMADLLVVLFVHAKRNGSIFVGAGDKDGNRHACFFQPDEIVYVFEPRV